MDDRWPKFGARTDDKRAGEAASAAAALPLLLELVPATSVVHVGFGDGAWLAEAQRLGVSDVCGIDGPWAGLEGLLVARDQVSISDTRQPFDGNGRSYDLALCIEYAEHFPDDLAGTLVASLASLAPVVAFSAAIPGQSGEGHVNEQWPSYWERHFAAVGYRMVDAVRHRLWTAPGIPYYLAQNLLIAVADRQIAAYQELVEADAGRHGDALSLVHPLIYEQLCERAGIRAATRSLLRTAASRARRQR